MTDQNATEMDTFLPSNDESRRPDSNGEQHNSVAILPMGKSGHDVQIGVSAEEFNPFTSRNNPHPTSDLDTFVHLLKASLGTGILSMPFAFKCSGLAVGLVATFITAIVCTYCSYIVVKCAHTLYYRAKVTTLGYADVAECAFAHGPPAVRKYGSIARKCIMVALFVTYFGAISCYTTIAAQNFRQVVSYKYEEVKYWDLRIFIVCTLPPLLLLSFVPNLKALAPFSMVANVLISCGLGITIFFLVKDGIVNPASVRQQPQSIMDLPATFSITVFAMEAIGLMMPLENNMKTPKHFLGICGVLNKGMSVVSMVYIIVGVLGFLKYQEKTEANITANLPVDSILPIIAKLLVAVSVILTYALQYFVCLEMLWPAVKEKFVKREAFANRIMRLTIVVLSVLLAVAVPDIGPFVSLIGAFCFSFLGIIFPLIIEIVTYYETVPLSKLMLRSLFFFLFGIMALFVGSYTSILEILQAKDSGVGISSNGTTNGTANYNVTSSAVQ